MEDDGAFDAKAEIEALKRQVGVLEDVNAIRTLQFAYGYYLDKCLYEEVVDLYADDGEVRFGGGIYRGKPGLRRLYLDLFRKNFTGGINGPVYGFLLDHQQSQDIIDVAPDRDSAKARFRCFMQAGTHVSKAVLDKPGQLQQWWEGGIYENEYVRRDGIWKIKVLDYNLVFHATFEQGWAHWERRDFNARTTYPENPIGPDELIPGRASWPDTPVVPFHYPHPVTGAPWKA